MKLERDVVLSILKKKNTQVFNQKEHILSHKLAYGPGPKSPQVDLSDFKIKFDLFQKIFPHEPFFPDLLSSVIHDTKCRICH